MDKAMNNGAVKKGLLVGVDDDAFLLALSIDPDWIENKREWVAKFRALHAAKQAGPTTVAEVDEINRQFGLLMEEVREK